MFEDKVVKVSYLDQDDKQCNIAMLVKKTSSDSIEGTCSTGDSVIINLRQVSNFSISILSEDDAADFEEEMLHGKAMQLLYSTADQLIGSIEKARLLSPTNNVEALMVVLSRVMRKLDPDRFLEDDSVLILITGHPRTGDTTVAHINHWVQKAIEEKWETSDSGLNALYHINSIPIY